MNKKNQLYSLIAWAIFSSTASAMDNPEKSHVIGHYRFPAALYSMMESGLEIPIMLDNAANPSDSKACGEECYVSIGKTILFSEHDKLGLRNIQTSVNDDNNIKLSTNLINQFDGINNKYFDDKLNLSVTPWAWFSLDVSKMRLILHIQQQGFGVVTRPRQFDMDAPSNESLSGTISYNFGGYSNNTSQGLNTNSGYLNANSTTSLGAQHFILNGSMYVGNSISSDRSGRINAALWERDYKGMRYAAGALDSWSMQSVGNVTALDGGDIYGFSLGNAASSRKRDKTLSLTPVVVFFSQAGEARLYRDGKLINIQRFAVGNHEIDTSVLPYGIYSVDIEVVSGGHRLSRSVYQINKPFSAEVGDSMRWQVWGGAYNRDRYNNNQYDNEKKNLDREDDFSQNRKQLLSLLGISLGKSNSKLEWSSSGYMLRNRIIAEVSASTRLISWLSLNTQGMAASDGSSRTNVGTNLNLPYNAGSVWYSYSRLSTGHFLALYENKGVNWGVSLNVPFWGFIRNGVVTFNEDRDAIYGYKRRRLDYSQALYAGRYGSVRLRTGVATNSSNYGYHSHTSRERYVMLDFSIPLGDSISAGISHSRESGTNFDLNATHHFEGEYLKSVSANMSKSFSGNATRSVAGGVTADIDTPFNANSVSVQTDNDKGWNGTLTSAGSVGWSGMSFGADKGTSNAGVMIDTGLKSGEKLMLDVDGRSYPLKGNRNYIPLPPYSNYKIELMNSADTLDNYEIDDSYKNKVALYPGNVVHLTPKVKKIVTVFGRLVDRYGHSLAKRRIKNSFGLAETESDGRFVIDVDTLKPVLDIETSDNSVCSITLEFKSTQGAQWLGDVKCAADSYVANASVSDKGSNKS